MLKECVCTMVLATGMLLAGEFLWDGVNSKVRISGGSLPDTKIVVENNEMVITGTNQGKGYEYIIFDIPIQEFVIGDKAIGVEIYTETPQEGDSFYVKALDSHSRNVLSFMTWGVPTDYKKFTCIPGYNSKDGMKWFASDVRSPIETSIKTLRIFLGRKPGFGPVRTHIRNIALVEPPPMPKKVECVDLGVGIGSAELRNYTAFCDAKGHPYVLSMLLDMGKPYVLLTDAMTGENLQYYVPDGVHGQVFGGILTEEGKFSGMTSAVLIAALIPATSASSDR